MNTSLDTGSAGACRAGSCMHRLRFAGESASTLCFCFRVYMRVAHRRLGFASSYQFLALGLFLILL